MSDLAKVVLRDVPKQEVRIDLWTMPIKGGFRGFSGVPASSWHYVSVLHQDQHVGFWCRTTEKGVVVKRFDDGMFVDDETEMVTHFTQLAQSGAMNHVLLPYPVAGGVQWLALTQHLPQESFPPTLYEEDTGEEVSRFERAFLRTHQGNTTRFLAEFEYAFLCWLLQQDEAAMVRWRHLLLACYNAGERRIIKAEALFVKLAYLLSVQFSFLPDPFFQPDSWVMMQVSYMIEDMIDSDIGSLKEQATFLKAYLAERVG